VDTPAGASAPRRVGIAAGHSSVLAKLAGFRLPVTSYALQGDGDRAPEPTLDVVVIAPGTGAYVSQSDKGEMVIGASLDLFPSYAQRGSFGVLQNVVRRRSRCFRPLVACACCATGPASWMCARLEPDHRADAGARAVHQLRLGNRGSRPSRWAAGRWRTRFATGRSHELAEAFQLERFITGRLIDEAAATGIAH